VAAGGARVYRGRDLEFGAPFSYLVRAEIENHKPSECPMCGEGEELTKPGSKRTQAGAA
jgi:hypothetical protein